MSAPMSPDRDHDQGDEFGDGLHQGHGHGVLGDDHDEGHGHAHEFGDDPGDVELLPLPEGVRVRSHPEIRTLLLTSDELTAWLLDERTGGVRHLNQAAAAVWALIEEPVTLAELSADLAATFDLDASVADEVVEAAVDALRAEELLELTHPDGSVVTAADTGASPASGSGDSDGHSNQGGGDEARLPALLTRAPDP